MLTNKLQNWKSYQNASQRPHTHDFYQLSHVNPGYAIPLAMCILMLPMLMIAVEHVQLTMTEHMNLSNQCGDITFSHAPLVLPPLNNVLPAMVLQNRIEKLDIGYPLYSSSYCSVRCVSLSLGLKVYSSLWWRVVEVVTLLLLLSGDIELNPGPLSE